MSTIINSPNIQKDKLYWSPKTMMKTKLITDVQLSPNKKSVLFVVTEPNMEDEKGVLTSRIYKSNPLKKDSATPFSSANVSSLHPRWSPDGQWIAFISTREGVNNIYLISSTGGEAIALTKGKRDVQAFRWSPDGKKIAFVMADDTESCKNKKKTSLAYVYQEHCTINRLWALDVFSSTPIAESLTNDDYCVRRGGDSIEFDWSPDSTKIAFAYSPNIEEESFFLDSSLATVDLISKIIDPWEKLSPYEASPSYSPDGSQVAYISGHLAKRYSIHSQIATRSSSGKSRAILSPTFNEGQFLLGQSLLGWTQDGKNILFFEPKGTKFHLVLLPADGTEAKEIKTNGMLIREPSLSYDKSMLAFTLQSPDTPPEAFIANLNDFSPLQVSSLNLELLSYSKPKTEIVSWASEDGMQIEGLLTYPTDYKAGKQYPLLLIIHGGPMSFFNEYFLGTPYPYPFASFAEEGFLILRPNPRGSCGYGIDFRSANYHDWGGADFSDIMSGVDSMIEKSIADPKRLGVMGWSYGGYMTAWTITQTSRFKAASMGAGISNLVSMNGTTDIHKFLTDFMGIFPHSRRLYEDRSPINHVLNVQTPCLIQHGIEDKRVHVTQGYEFYHALKRLGKEVTFVLYPGMGHHLSDPKMMLDAMERNLAWFKQHLQN